MGQLGEVIWGAGILAIVAIFGVGRTDPTRDIHRVDICVMRNDNSTVTMNVWSDQVKSYVYHYPGTLCGACTRTHECPLDTRGYK